MRETKIQLSQREMELMCNAEILLTKNRILQKVRDLLEELQNSMTEVCPVKNIPLRNEVFIITPKISRGENYIGLPYLILDYPRKFTAENIFAIRTLFWWGNFFSITLHLAGSYNHLLLSKAGQAFDLLAGKQFYLGINDDPWQHHFEPVNYLSLDTLTKEEFIKKVPALPHIKIAAKWPLTEWTFAANNLWESWKLLLQILD